MPAERTLTIPIDPEAPAPKPGTQTTSPSTGGGKLEFAIGVLNGVLGDYLHRESNGLATPMELFVDGRPVPLERAALQQAYPAATRRLVLFVHGFAVTEAIWTFPDEPGVSYGELLRQHEGLTPLYLRYNTGLHISENGEALARLLEQLVAAFPSPIDELILVGYSMGGLVVRSACHAATEAGHGWLSKVRRALYLAVPHLGSPLERLGKVVASTLRAIPSPYTQLVADVVNLRSNGVKDLGLAHLTKEGWQSAADAPLLHERRHPVPLLPGIAHHLLVGTLAPEEHHLVSLLFGDGVVTMASAAGRPGPEELSPLFPQENVRVVTGINHVTLAHHESVYPQVRAWCQTELA